MKSPICDGAISRQRAGIVLVIVLAMLSLFSVLIVTYVVFAAQARDTSYGLSMRRLRELDYAPIHGSIVKQVLAGGGTKSAAFSQDLLRDIYGVDSLQLRVAHDRSGGGPSDAQFRAMLLRPSGAGHVETTLFKFPLHLVPWHNDGSDGASAALANSVLTPLSNADFGVANLQALLAQRQLPDYRLNDAFTGRLITFAEGPLQGNTFRIVRYFGTVHSGGAADAKLAGSIIIDLSEAMSSTVTFDGAVWNLQTLARQNPNALVYKFGPDEKAGFSGNPNDAPGESGSDDYGCSLTMNGVAFNGLGENAFSASRVTRVNPYDPTRPFVIDSQFGPELLPNRKITGAVMEQAQQDELYDAPDFENWFLAWQPADHRAILPSVAANLASTTGMSVNDALKAAPNIIPSFHRPEVINYLMHKPIWYDDNSNGLVDPSELRAFADLTAGGQNDDIRLQILIRRLRSATFRPLNFEHLFVSATENTSLPPEDPRRQLHSDLNGDGDTFDGNPYFSGSHPLSLLNSPIEVKSSTSFATLYEQISKLATWLINGPWDVDNDGDGLPDSVWVDFDLPTQELDGGVKVRPYVAALIEDLDGRINVNVAGNYAQITSQRFQSVNPTTYSNNDPSGYFDVGRSLQTFGRGGGLGPAEINFVHLFDEFRNGSSRQPIFYTQTSVATPNVLTTRYGNLLQSRYGGRPWDYASTLNSIFFEVAHPGQNSGPTALPLFSDPFSRLLFGMRRNSHQVDGPMGRPLDVYGRSTTRKLVGGNAQFDMIAADPPTPVPTSANVMMSEIVNQPYEFEIDDPVGDDKPFTPSEFHALADDGTGRMLADRLASLLDEAMESNEAISRLLTYDSRSLNGVELPGGFSVMDFLASRLHPSLRSNPSALNVQIQRMLAVELRKGGKLNLNRPTGNGVNDGTLGGVVNNATDETLETRQYDSTTGQVSPDGFALEPAFPQLDNDNTPGNSSSPFEAQSMISASYLPLDLTASGQELDRLTGAELLARNLYCLMFRLILDPEVDVSNFSSEEFVPKFPYPEGFSSDIQARNHYVAKRLAQWSANAVDMRDTDAIMTRLRYDPNPFDANGFDLGIAASCVVWGMERPELALTETFAMHDRRVAKDLDTPMDTTDPTINPDGELPTAVDPNPMDTKDRDSDLDQFRIPEASAYVEIQSLRDPFVAPALNSSQESFPAELYTFDGTGRPLLDLSRTVGTGADLSPVWRLAVGYTTAGGGGGAGHQRSTLWTQDARRFGALDASLPSPFTAYGNLGNDLMLWDEVVSKSADILHSPGNNSSIHLYDNNLNPADGSSAANVSLSRFVWFTSVEPDTNLKVTGIGSAASGMRPDNVFYCRTPLTQALLEPGKFAVVSPRVSTTFGRTEESKAADDWPYCPSNQKLEIVNGSSPTGYALRYIGIDGTRSSPDYRVDNPNEYRVQDLLPIIAEARPPHEVDTTGSSVATAWSTYFTNTAAADRVSLGFNISAPLSGGAYYDAPTHRINDTQGANSYYPQVDGYRDYINDSGLHPDKPFDERNGSPLKDNSWIGVGTYQDVAGIYLQRLADPTMPWDPTHNPYITVDAMSMDLTVFNGDYDLREEIDHDSDPVTPEILVDDPNTPVYPTTLAFDTRRKIPDAERDRVQSQVLLNVQKQSDWSNNVSPTDPDSYRRWVFTQRSLLMTRQNALRNKSETGAAAGSRPFFRHELLSAWSNGTAASNTTSTLHSSFHYQLNTATAPDEDVNAFRFDKPTESYPATLGFVAREYGEPAIAYSTFAASGMASDPGLYVGHPIAVSLQTPTWFDRPFQSIYNLMIVPATSSFQLNREYDPGTKLTVAGTAIQETAVRFAHLLGFEAGIAENLQSLELADTSVSPGATINASTRQGMTTLTGQRPGFEQIFDLVDIGALSFGERKWFDPTQTKRLGTINNDQDAIFNRALQLHQAPFNYAEKHRTPGKINLNTAPDYIRQGSGFQSAFGNDADLQRPFVTGVNPRDLASTNVNMSITSSPNNHLAGHSTDPFNTAILYGNGSVYRSIASGFSTFYDLDDRPTEPVTLGSQNGYKSSIDSRFGYGFKEFIVSRRGYATTLFNPSETLSQLHFLNPDLDYRYPTRFAGVFTPTAGSVLGSMQRHMRAATAASNQMTLRRTHDTGLLRPSKDFDLRLMDASSRTAATSPSATDFAMAVETPPSISSSNFSQLHFVPNASGAQDSQAVTPIESMVMKVVNVGAFERPQAELHKNQLLIDRDPFFRFQNPAYLDGMTTHHSNVFVLRYTVGFFVVDPVTGAAGEEYFDPNEGYRRPKGFHIIDRSIPVGYEPLNSVGGRRELNMTDAIRYSFTK